MVDEVSPWCEHAKSHERERAEQAELAIAHDTVVVRAEGDHAVVDEVSLGVSTRSPKKTNAQDGEKLFCRTFFTEGLDIFVYIW